MGDTHHVTNVTEAFFLNKRSYFCFICI